MGRKLTNKQFKEKEKRLDKKREIEKTILHLDLDVERIPKISQSLMKALYQYKTDNYCGLVLEHIYIKGKHLPYTKSQKWGYYLEYICTGALPPTKEIPEPELLKTGEPNMYYARLHKHKETFDTIMNHYGFEIDKIGYEFNNPKYSGVADIIAIDTNLKTSVKNKKRIIIDLKTSSLINDRFSDYGWSEKSIDKKYELLLQSIHYKMLAKYEWGIEDIPFYFFVFSTKNENECKVYKIDVAESTRHQHLRNLNNTKIYLDEQLKKGFKAKPDFIRCGNCGLSETCLSKTNIPLPKKVFI